MRKQNKSIYSSKSYNMLLKWACIGSLNNTFTFAIIFGELGFIILTFVLNFVVHYPHLSSLVIIGLELAYCFVCMLVNHICDQYIDRMLNETDPDLVQCTTLNDLIDVMHAKTHLSYKFLSEHLDIKVKN